MTRVHSPKTAHTQSATDGSVLILRDRDRDVLNELRACQDSGMAWARPLDCGGSNGSDHSYRLSKMAAAGLSESRPRGAWAGSRGSKEYRITDAGRAALARAFGRQAAVSETEQPGTTEGREPQ